jgi:hypothetical protein
MNMELNVDVFATMPSTRINAKSLQLEMWSILDLKNNRIRQAFE